jgi:ribosome-binding factor A
VADAVPETAAHIEDLLAKVAAADAEVHRSAAGATYAGDADPYKVPRSDADDADDDDDIDTIVVDSDTA